MKIIRFRNSDMKEIMELFYETVHSINAQDYSPAQLDVWAPKEEQVRREQSWMESLSNNISFVARMNDVIVGFADMSHSGYLDRLYVHKHFQRQGIASSLVDVIESEAKKLALMELSTEASITAKPIFVNRGYQIVQKQNIERKGVTLVNYKMIKALR
ncbi:GNAT family N-acetyltransferase [Paenibacillus sp. SC116]|uniref:GNAT family N-acetyltransferase n=1 Tax=Paenibacillus sp. SC116 TaxID=2968986 RepID=UPI00215B0384|nr:GNAT family N-acetyltransferase [Paenibacillus sp. SC116]MCR8842418.1 GNAT family N-acetyltransferase [Paenibacillus sp. SC116]